MAPKWREHFEKAGREVGAGGGQYQELEFPRGSVGSREGRLMSR